MRTPRNCLAAAAGLAIAIAIGAVHTTAHAQMTFMATQEIGDPGSSTISRRGVDRYAEILELDGDQRPLVEALYEGYAAAAQQAETEFRDAMNGARQSFDDTGDPGAFMEVMPAAREKRDKTMKALEAQFFDDLALVIDDAQKARWPRVERLRRRETLLPNGSLSGETVDLTELVAKLDLPDPARAALDEPIVQYEVELDRSLASRDQIQKESREAMDFGRGGNFQLDPDKIEKMKANAAKSREASLAVKAVNDRYARVLASKLPEDVRPEFEAAYHTESFPQVYRTSSVETALEAAQGFDDLTADQRRAIADLLVAHQRDVQAANAKWADAIEHSESEDEGALAFGAGMMIRMGMDDSEGPVGEARAARRDIDQKTREKLLNLLSDDQRERLPKPRERQQNGWVTDGAVVGQQMVIEVQEDDGGG